MRKITFAEEEFYHLYNRGVEKREIFTNRADYNRFLALLFLCNGKIAVDLKLQGRTLCEVQNIERGEPIVDICCYCLMSNHYHFLVREKTKNGISNFMQKLQTGYTMYFNKRYERSGALLQGTFKAEHANEDSYLSYLPAYIHLNPVKLIDPKWRENGIIDKKAAESFLKQYRYSSYPDYIGERRPEGCIINNRALPEYAETPVSFRRMSTEWLDYKKRTTLRILQG